MAIRKFEVFHGAVLTKLLRSDRPVSLRLIETNTAEQWSTYVLNTAANLFISYSTNGKAYTRDGGGKSWQFVFSKKQLQQLRDAGGAPVYAALVCGANDLASDEAMDVCLLEPGQVSELFKSMAKSPSISVKRPNGKGQLRVVQDYKEVFLVPRSKIDKWAIPGS